MYSIPPMKTLFIQKTMPMSVDTMFSRVQKRQRNREFLEPFLHVLVEMFHLYRIFTLRTVTLRKIYIMHYGGFKMISTSALYTCTVFSNTVGIVKNFVGPFFLLCQCVRSSVRMIEMTKLAFNVKATSYQRCIQNNAA